MAAIMETLSIMLLQIPEVGGARFRHWTEMLQDKQRSGREYA